jgi:membrane protein DedA with SNARE-associated domain
MHSPLLHWGYYPGIFFGILATGMGFPMPEELPIVLAGILAGHNLVFWWTMLPVCILAVILGDSCLYGIGRLWGPRLTQSSWVQRHFLPPEQLQRIESNFHKYGIRILLFARLTPGIRAPIFLTAGIIRLPLFRFVLADGLYAIPGVSVLFFLGYYFGEGIIALVERAERVKFLLMLLLLLGISAYLVYRFFRKPVVTGAPEEMPPLVGPVTAQLDEVTTRTLQVLRRSTPPAAAPPETETTPPVPPASSADGTPGAQAPASPATEEPHGS